MADAPHVVVVTMVQKADLPSAMKSVASVRAAFRDVPRLVLWNDESDSQVLSELAETGAVVIDAESNLGVARGRNLLIGRASEMGAAWIIALDDDVLVPRDYGAQIRRAIAAAGKEGGKIGLVAPTVLSIPSLREYGFSTGDAEMLRRWLRSTRALRAQLRSNFGDAIPRSVVEYMGVSGWARHYLSAHGAFPDQIRRLLDLDCSLEGVNGALRSKQWARHRIGKGSPPIAVDTVPGGVSAMSMDLLNELGTLNESLGYFGYEDAELCIRARQAGYGVYVAPSALVLHDLQERGRLRKLQEVFPARNRNRAVLLATHNPPRFGDWIFELFVLGLPEYLGVMQARYESGAVDEAARLYLAATASFGYQWHLAQGTNTRVPFRDNRADEVWSVSEDYGQHSSSLAVERNAGTQGDRVVSSRIELSVIAGGRVSWVVQVETRDGSRLLVDARLQTKDVTQFSWELLRLRVEWVLSTTDASRLIEIRREGSTHAGSIPGIVTSDVGTVGCVDIDLQQPIGLSEFSFANEALRSDGGTRDDSC